MKKVLSLSLITAALFIAGCAQESTEKKSLAENSSAIKILHTVELAEPDPKESIVRERVSQDQESMKVMRTGHSSVMAAQQFQNRSRNLTMSPPQYLLAADNEKYNHQKNNGPVEAESTRRTTVQVPKL